MPKVIVVGGGYAGVSAATALAEKGIQVELLESRGALGGRVYSTPPSDAFPAPVDNGPHLFMGCYLETLRLFERLGAPPSFHWLDPLGLSWLVEGGKKASFQCAPLPAPFHLAAGLLFSNAFPFREKFSLIRALSVFSKRPFPLDPAVETVAQFLDATRQGPRSRERFWIPVSNAVMNVPPGEAPLQGLGEVLHRAFFGSRRDGALAVASRPLSEVVFPQAVPFLETAGSKVFFHEGVQSFQADGRSFALGTRSGKSWTGDALVWAVPPSSLASLWPADALPSREDFSKLGKSPILSAHLILSAPVLEGHFVGLPGARFDWVFNRNANWGWEGEGQYLSFTAGAAEDLARAPEAEVVRLAFQELQDRCPRARSVRILHSKVTREMAATFFWNKAAGKFRPSCETSLPNIFLAGDWTDTGLPATIEGACLSGHRAAEKCGAALLRTSK